MDLRRPSRRRFEAMSENNKDAENTGEQEQQEEPVIDMQADEMPQPTVEDAQQADEAARVAELEAEVAALKDRLMRAIAETENVRRRATKEKEDASKYALSRFAGDLLSVADNLSRALESVPQDARAESEVIGNLMVGVEGTQRELMQVFERFGIKPVAAEGEAFDPNKHEALFEIEHAEAKPGTVLQVVQGGYVIHDRLLRPARVGVAKAAEAPAEGVDTKA